MNTRNPDYRWSIRGKSWGQVYRVGHGYGDLDVDSHALLELHDEQRRRLGEALIAAAELDLAAAGGWPMVGRRRSSSQALRRGMGCGASR